MIGLKDFENARLRARVAELEGHLDIEKRLTHEMESERDVALARVAELEQELEYSQMAADVEAREADRGRTRVAELEKSQVGVVECPHCNTEHDVQISRRRINDPNVDD